ncbi:Vancomycin B-type resistance protein VanW [compost metagenome]
MTGRVKVGVAIAVGAVAVLSLGIALCVNRPFQAELGSYRTSLVDRSETQRHNIRQAAMALDGNVIEPGDTFSFNETVGPRTPDRGYRDAPAYMERDLITSIGGGICQVSSTLYNAAALSGLLIVERHPHFRKVSSVPPGRDATVWYGAADLRFTNTYPHPVKIVISSRAESLRVSLFGSRYMDLPMDIFTISRLDSTSNRLIVTSFRKYRNSQNGIERLPLYRDVYLK